jgi:GDPmannose 4,6-dehydratase
MNKVKKALVTGATGQDGSYLCELLLSKGYEVHVMIRPVAVEVQKHRTWRINHILDKIVVHSGTLENYASIFDIVQRVKPDECYHLAAQSFVHLSFDDCHSTMNTNINGTLFMLSAIHKIVPGCKFYFAGSSEMFGLVNESPQSESTRFHPRSPYGISKVAGFDLTRNFREAYDMFACSGTLFNHESCRRGHQFVTRKITRSVARISLGKQHELKLGNLDARRDWGHAKDYVLAMYLMLQSQEPDDFVIATGTNWSVRDFVEKAFNFVGIYDWEKFVSVDPKFYRPAEVHTLTGDYSKAKRCLGWEPNVDFDSLVKMMVLNDLEIEGK